MPQATRDFIRDLESEISDFKNVCDGPGTADFDSGGSGKRDIHHRDRAQLGQHPPRFIAQAGGRAESAERLPGQSGGAGVPTRLTSGLPPPVLALGNTAGETWRPMLPPENLPTRRIVLTTSRSEPPPEASNGRRANGKRLTLNSATRKCSKERFFSNAGELRFANGQWPGAAPHDSWGAKTVHFAVVRC